MGIIERKPKCNKYKESEHRVRRFTPDEEKKTLAFFDRIGHQDMADYTVLSLDTGMRQSEVLSLHFEDIQNGRVTVWGVGATGQRTKSGKSRTVPLTARAQAVFDRRREYTEGKAVFPSLSKTRSRITGVVSRRRSIWKATSNSCRISFVMSSAQDLLLTVRTLLPSRSSQAMQHCWSPSAMCTSSVMSWMMSLVAWKRRKLAGNRATTVIVDEIETDTQALAQLLSQLPQDQLKAIFKTVISAS